MKEKSIQQRKAKVRWVAREEVANMDLAYDMLNLLRVFEEDNLSELSIGSELENDFIRDFGKNMNYLFKWMNSFLSLKSDRRALNK